MLMILARLVRSESFWAVAKVRSPHTGPEPGYPRKWDKTRRTWPTASAWRFCLLGAVWCLIQAGGSTFVAKPRRRGVETGVEKGVKGWGGVVVGS